MAKQDAVFCSFILGAEHIFSPLLNCNKQPNIWKLISMIYIILIFLRLLLFLLPPPPQGGFKGFDKVVWEVAEYKKGENPSITFKYRSRDGEEGSLSLSLTSHSYGQSNFCISDFSPLICFSVIKFFLPGNRLPRGCFCDGNLHTNIKHDNEA